MGRSLSQRQVRLLTGGFKTKTGKIRGGFIIPKDIQSKVRRGEARITKSKTGLGVEVKGTKKGIAKSKARLKKLGM